LAGLADVLDGTLEYDRLVRILYATDASVYRELPLAVAFPKHKNDIQFLVRFANLHDVSLIPRAAGTSLAGQCVGSGIVVDTSRFMTKILEINEQEKWVRVEPGVIRDELNQQLAPLGLQFGPNTSTSNRCMMGGMVGNNSCGTTSIYAGATRDHTLELKTILSDGEEATFSDLTKEAFEAKRKVTGREGELYNQIHKLLSNANNFSKVISEFPKASVSRRNTGYALDSLLQNEIFSAGQGSFNFF